MALYTKVQFDLDNDAVNAADSCISAAVVEAGYGARLNKHSATLIDILDYFKEDIDKKPLARMMLTLVRGEKISGFQSKEFAANIERIRRKLKGKKLVTELSMMENRTKPSCSHPNEHRQPCKCKRYEKFKLKEAQGLAEGGM